MEPFLVDWNPTSDTLDGLPSAAWGKTQGRDRLFWGRGGGPIYTRAASHRERPDEYEVAGFSYPSPKTVPVSASTFRSGALLPPFAGSSTARGFILRWKLHAAAGPYGHSRRLRPLSQWRNAWSLSTDAARGKIRRFYRRPAWPRWRRLAGNLIATWLIPWMRWGPCPGGVIAPGMVPRITRMICQRLRRDVGARAILARPL